MRKYLIRICEWCLSLSLMTPCLAAGIYPFADQHASPAKNPATSAQADRILIQKGNRTLFLVRGDTILRSYPIALGIRPTGPKRQEGDARTPEGRYTIDSRNAHSRYHRSLHVSYPNPADRLRALVHGISPGGLIMIHGQPSGSHPEDFNPNDWTLGCIAVSNQAIDEIWTLVSDGTPVEILP